MPESTNSIQDRLHSIQQDHAFGLCDPCGTLHRADVPRLAICLLLID